MGLFSKKIDLSKFEVAESDTCSKFTVDGKSYDLEKYVSSRESELRAKFMGNPVKIGKNQDKTKKDYLKKKDAVSYIEFAIGKQLAEGAEKCKVTALEVKNNVR